MSGKLEKTLNSVFGCPTESNTTQIDFTGTAASGVLEANQNYRLVSDQDCYISFIKPGPDAQATTAGVLMTAGIPEVFTTTERETAVSVIRKTSSGELVITKLKTRGV